MLIGERLFWGQLAALSAFHSFSKPQAAPSILLVVLIEITIAAIAAQILLRRRTINTVRKLAANWGMHYQPADAFGLTERVAEHMPMPGAAKLIAMDLIYRQQGDDFFCAFTITFTAGALATKHRRWQVAAVHQVGNHYSWATATADDALADQYEQVRQELLGKSSATESVRP
ncbi:MAG TPA: hypothetical protein VGG19_18625 [Tepidisphaeraceae bacterium]|jgi:hypothetical protein